MWPSVRSPPMKMEWMQNKDLCLRLSFPAGRIASFGIACSLSLAGYWRAGYGPRTPWTRDRKNTGGSLAYPTVKSFRFVRACVCTVLWSRFRTKMCVYPPSLLSCGVGGRILYLVSSAICVCCAWTLISLWFLLSPSENQISSNEVEWILRQCF